MTTLGIDTSNLRAGGGITHLVALLQAAQPAQHGIERVVVWGGQQTLGRLPRQPWLTLVHEPWLDGPLPQRVAWQQAKLARLAIHACDLLFVPGGTYRGSFRPFVTMSRNMLPSEPTEAHRFGLSWTAARYSLLRRSQSASFRRAEGVIFLTEYARSVVARAARVEAHRQVVIPHGVDQHFRLAPRPQRPINAYDTHNPFRVLYVSTINFYKHQWHVATAVAQLRRQGYPVVLDLIGSAYPPALERLRQVLDTIDPVGDCIRYHGPVPFAELAKLYHGADAFVFASSCENMPNILLEAMAAGLPIACSDRGPMPEVLGEAGVYVDPENAQDLATALSHLIDAPAVREKYAWAAYQRAHLYSWDQCASATFAFLTEVLHHDDAPLHRATTGSDT